MELVQQVAYQTTLYTVKHDEKLYSVILSEEVGSDTVRSWEIWEDGIKAIQVDDDLGKKLMEFVLDESIDVNAESQSERIAKKLKEILSPDMNNLSFEDFQIEIVERLNNPDEYGIKDDEQLMDDLLTTYHDRNEHIYTIYSKL